MSYGLVDDHHFCSPDIKVLKLLIHVTHQMQEMKLLSNTFGSLLLQSSQQKLKQQTNDLNDFKMTEAISFVFL